MPVRSGVLAFGLSPGAGQQSQIGTVPAGLTWIIKDVRLFNNGVATGTTQLWVTDAAQNFAGYIINETMTVPKITAVSCFVCVPPGGTVQVLWQGASMFVWLSGAQLPGHI